MAEARRKHATAGKCGALPHRSRRKRRGVAKLAWSLVWRPPVMSPTSSPIFNPTRSAAAPLTQLIESLEREIECSWRLEQLRRECSSLCGRVAKARLDGWWLDVLPGEPVPAGICGTIVRTPSGKTSTVTAYDPATRRIETRSGSVYELGLPQTSFAAANRKRLRRLGF